MNKDIKKLKSSGGDYITDTNFKPLMFTQKQALTWAKKATKHQEKMFKNGFKFKETLIKDCGTHYTINRY